MKKILVLTDFSEASRNAFTFARSFFDDTLADFHLLYVYPAQASGFNGLKHNAESARLAGTDQLQAMVVELRKLAINDWHTYRSTAKPGQPLEVVEQMVKTEMYDFVLIGPVTSSVSELFGNSAIALVHRLKANVLVVPTTAQARPVSHVVLSIDFASLKNSKLLSPIKEFVTLKGAVLTLLSIETPSLKVIHPEQEIHIRQFLKPIKPVVARLTAPTAKEGIDAYLAGHEVDLLVTIPHFKAISSALPVHSDTHTQAYMPLVPLLTLYDDGSDDLPKSKDDVLNVDYVL